MMVAIDLSLYVQQCAPSVAANTMIAIVKTESKGNVLALGLNRGHRLRFQPKNYDQAVAWVTYLDNHGYDFDIGLGQINIKNVKKYGYKAIDMLEPCKNLNLASLILKRNYTGALSTSANSREALHKAISAYNTGNYKRGFNNGYVQRVLNNAYSSGYNLQQVSLTKTAVNDNVILPKNKNLSSKTILYAKNKSDLHNSSVQFAQNN